MIQTHTQRERIYIYESLQTQYSRVASLLYIQPHHNKTSPKQFTFPIKPAPKRENLTTTVPAKSDTLAVASVNPRHRRHLISRTKAIPPRVNPVSHLAHLIQTYTHTHSSFPSIISDSLSTSVYIYMYTTS